jgi:hypothetical protein
MGREVESRQDVHRVVVFKRIMCHLLRAFAESADILFQYPDKKLDGRSDCQILIQVRGIFMTLNQLLSEIQSVNGSGQGSADSMIVSSIVVGNGGSPADLIHVAYVGEGEDLLVIGAPGKLQARLGQLIWA